MSTIIEVGQMQASVADEVTTLSPTSGVSDNRPGHLAIVSAVITLSANTAEFFKPAAQGVRYRLTISREG